MQRSSLLQYKTEVSDVNASQQGQMYYITQTKQENKGKFQTKTNSNTNVKTEVDSSVYIGTKNNLRC